MLQQTNTDSDTETNKETNTGTNTDKHTYRNTDLAFIRIQILMEIKMGGDKMMRVQ